MLRFTDAMLNNKELEEKIGFKKREEEFMREFFLNRVQEESVLSGQSFMYLHYADMIANGYIRTMPCPFQSQGLLLNPDGKLFYCENSKELGNVLDETAEAIYFRAANLEHREELKKDVCPTCLSPCQVNVGAMKQFVPYAKFLMRAYRVKRDPARHLETIPTGAMTQPDVCAPCAADRVVARVRRPPPPHPRCRRSSRPISCGEAIRPRSFAQPPAPSSPDSAGGPARVLDRALMAQRWIALLCIVEGRRPPLARLLEIFLTSTFLGTFLPASIGGDAVRAYSLSRDSVSAPTRSRRSSWTACSASPRCC